MLIYLNNANSVGPNSLRARNVERRGGREVGLNENLGREVLELHTLGVRSGYSQADVTEFAKALTGWTLDQMRPEDEDAPTVIFDPKRHEPDDRIILGKVYPEGGAEQALAILDDLSLRAETAHFIATKLVRAFVADNPPADAVKRIAKIFRDTRGNLPAIHAALVDLDSAWAQPFAKMRTSEEWITGCLRMLGSSPMPPDRLVNLCNMLGQPIWKPGAPAGWPDIEERWLSSDAVMKRLEIANVFAGHAKRGADARELSVSAYGPLLSERSQFVIGAAENGRQALALVSPEAFRR